MKTFRLCCLAAAVCCAMTAVAQDTTAVKAKYTFSDFFDALELPTMVGVGITPAGYEGVTFNTAFRLGWREGRTYGGFAYVEYDMHLAEYKELKLSEDLTVFNGDVTYNDLFLAGGYRLPLVKDLGAYYRKPYHNPVSLFLATGPGLSIPQIKAPISSADGVTMTEVENPIVPAWKVALGVDWLVIPQLAVFLETSYTQHLKPTLIEQAAMEAGTIKGPSGPLMFQLGLCMFF